jgi:hypothetical protein
MSFDIGRFLFNPTPTQPPPNTGSTDLGEEQKGAMAMKKRFLILVVVIVGVFVLTACSVAQGVTQSLVGLPDDANILIFALVTAGVTWLLLKLSELTHVNLNGYANAIAAALAPVLVTLIEAALKLIPPVFDNLVLSIIHLIVLLISSLGTFFLFKRTAPSLK